MIKLNKERTMITEIDGRDPQELTKDELISHLWDVCCSGLRLCQMSETQTKRIDKLDARIKDLTGEDPDPWCSMHG